MTDNFTLENNIKTAFILAAGFGSRLKPHTDELPKALVHYQGKPMIENVISRLTYSGVNRFFINTHHFADKMEKYFAERQGNEEITLIHEKKILGTGGALKNAAGNLSPYENFLIFNTDVDCDTDIEKFYNFHINSGSIASLCVQNRVTSRYLIASGSGLLAGRTENNEDIIYSDYLSGIKYYKTAFCGIHAVNKKIFSYLINEPDYFDIIPFYMKLLKSGEKISVYDITSSRWKDLGIPENL